MTEKQIKWQEALLNPSAKAKLKQNAMVRLITSGVSPVTVRSGELASVGRSYKILTPPLGFA
jgi:hypothetical protein